MTGDAPSAPARLTGRIGLLPSVALAVSTIIGSGLLGLPGLAVARGGPQAALAGWLATMLLSVPLMLVFMRLTERLSDAGGLAAYAGIAFGPRGRGAATFILAATFTLCIPIGTMMGSAYLRTILALPAWSDVPIALVILAISTALNGAGVRPAAMVNSFAVVALIALIVIVSLSSPTALSGGVVALSDILSGRDVPPPSALWPICAILFWAFLGWENLSFGSEEMTARAGQLRFVFLVSFVVVGCLYLALALVATGAARQGIAVGGVTGLLALVEGSRFALPAKILIAFVVVANVNAWVFAASRLMYAGGRSGELPASLGHVGRNGTPVVALCTLLILYAALAGSIGTGVLPIELGLSVANQNFIVLYGAALVTYWQIRPSLLDRLLCILGAASCLLLLSGFGALLLVPLGLGLVGALRVLASRGSTSAVSTQ